MLGPWLSFRRLLCRSRWLSEVSACFTQHEVRRTGLTNADDIEVVMCTILEEESFLVEASDGIVLDINDINVWTIELFEVRVLEARTFHTPWVWWLLGNEDISLAWILDACCLFLLPKVIHCTVGFGVEEVIAIKDIISMVPEVG